MAAVMHVKERGIINMPAFEALIPDVALENAVS